MGSHPCCRWAKSNTGMRAAPLCPSGKLFNSTVILAKLASVNWKGVFGLFRSLSLCTCSPWAEYRLKGRAAKEQPKGKLRKCLANIISWMVDEAFRLLNNFIEDGHKPFPSLYAPVIKALCRRGQFDDAFCFFGDMKAKAHPPNRPLYTMLITMCGRAGKFVEAANYIFEMTEMGLVPISRCFDMVTDGLKNCGKHDLARRVQELEVSIRGV